MSYLFLAPDRLAFEIRRVATECLNDALDQLGGELHANPVEAVHEARKDLKKTRSLLRLVRESVGDDVFRVQNGRLREAAHQLASVREADALSEALEALVHAREGALSPEALAGSRLWQARREAAHADNPEVSLSAAKASTLIAAARDDARTWALGYGGFDLIEPGIRRTYRQGRRYLARAIADPRDENLHEWRKRVKDMWYSLRLMGRVWEPAIRPLADQAHELSDLLGDHHDLGELRRTIDSGEAGLSIPTRGELSAAAADRQAELHRAAIALGRRLYAERPRRYSERLSRLWAAWEEDAAQQLGQDGLPRS